MKEIIKFLSKYHQNTAPFISENEDGSFTLVGSSDYATGEWFDYGGLGKCKLTAKNHSKTLLALMNYILLLDGLSEAEELSFDDEEVIEVLKIQFSGVMAQYFGKEISYSHDIALKFLSDNPQLVNEALYNITKDKEQAKQVDYQSILDSLEGSQFEDPYISIAYEVAKEFKLRPFDVIENWTTSELIVTFAKIANDRSLDAFLSWKYSQKDAPKRKKPKKQAFYFEEIGGEEDD